MVVVKGSTNIAAEIFVAALGGRISVRVPKVQTFNKKCCFIIIDNRRLDCFDGQKEEK